MMDHVLHPGEVRVPLGRDAVAPALVLDQPLAAPVRDVERGIGEDEVGLQVRMAVVVEAVSVGDLSADPANGQVHPGEPPRRVVRLLAVDRDIAAPVATVAVAAGVGANELDRLHEHARGAAARIVDPPPVGFQHLDEQLDDAAWGVELAALFSLGTRELREEVLVDAAEHISGAGFGVPDADVSDHVDQLAETLLVQGGPRVVLGQHLLQRRVVPLDRGHGPIDGLADGRLPRPGLQVRPAGCLRHPEDVFGDVLVAILRGFLPPLGEHRRVALFEGVRDVLQEDDAEHDVLVLGGIH